MQAEPLVLVVSMPCFFLYIIIKTKNFLPASKCDAGSRRKETLEVFVASALEAASMAAMIALSIVFWS